MVNRFILQIRGGPLAFRKAILEPGGRLHVGRTSLADFIVPHDEQMSGIHFQLSWCGDECWLHDINSARGTLLGGEHVSKGLVTDGEWIRAGSTDFSAYMEHTSPSQDDQGDPQTTTTRTQALQFLREEGQRTPLYAVLDAARDARILQTLNASVDEHITLYEGIRAEVLAESAPYLVKLSPGTCLLERLVREGWGNSWGIYLTSQQPLLELRRHLRKLLFVLNEDTERQMYFRFYDPRVLSVFLPTCTPNQLGNIFHQVKQIIMEDASGSTLHFRTSILDQ